MQKTNFPYEILIHDDASTDGTEEIIREYAAKYPDIIKPLFEAENQYSKGVSISKTFIFPRVTGKYMAFCEGDDYWIDENKLQKQVDFMEANPDYTICFHPVKRVFETKIRENDTFPTADMIDAGFTFEKLLKSNFIKTNSVMYRWNAVKDAANNFPSDIMPGDWYLSMMFAKNGKMKFLNEVMSVYRINPNGVWFDYQDNKDRLFCNKAFEIMNFYNNVYRNFLRGNEQLYPVYWNKISYLNNVMKNSQDKKRYMKFKLLYQCFIISLFVRTLVYRLKMLTRIAFL